MSALQGRPELLLPLALVFVCLGWATMGMAGESLLMKKAGVVFFIAALGLGLAWWKFGHHNPLVRHG